LALAKSYAIGQKMQRNMTMSDTLFLLWYAMIFGALMGFFWSVFLYWVKL